MVCGKELVYYLQFMSIIDTVVNLIVNRYWSVEYYLCEDTNGEDTSRQQNHLYGYIVSYVGLEEHEMQPLGSSRRNSLSESNIKLLPGEILVTNAQNVLMFSPVSDLKQGTSGILSVTNFKLTFITSEDTNGEDTSRQQNHLYGYMDTCLTNIEDIYITVGDKKRKLVPGNTVPSKIKGIFIVCKNFRTWSFSFKFSPIGQVKKLLTALLLHAFPSRHQFIICLRLPGSLL